MPKNVDNNLNHEVVFIIKHNDFLAGHAIKNKIKIMHHLGHATINNILIENADDLDIAMPM